MKSLIGPLRKLLITTAGSGRTQQMEAERMRADLEELWRMDEIRMLPFDVEVVSSREDKGCRVDEIYFTSEMTPKGPNRIFCAFARPINPAKPVPVVLMIPGGGDRVDSGIALWAAQNQQAMVLLLDWSSEYAPYAPHRTDWRHPFPNPYSECARLTPTLRDNPFYHIVIGLRRALDFMSQQPNVDMTRVATYGGSWGGFFSFLLAGVDSRVGCIMSGLGSGGWHDSHSGLSKPVEELPEDQRELWHATYDPIVYAPWTKAAVLFVAASNDHYFWLGGLQEHYKALPGKKYLVIIPNCDHGFGGPKIVDASWWWIKQCFSGKPGSSEIAPDRLHRNGSVYAWKVRSPKSVIGAKLYWSPGNVVWSARYWVEFLARKRSDEWQAEIPAEFAGLSSEVYVTVMTRDGLSASSTTQRREGMDCRTAAGPLWADNPLWDTERGAGAWRSSHYNPYTFTVVAPGSFRLGPAKGQTQFAVLTNSVVLASGRAPEYSGIRLKINGKDKEGKLTVRFCRDSRSNREVPYGTIVDYQAGETTVDLPWSAFKGLDGATGFPYPFDALLLEGDRADGSAIIVRAIELYK